MDNPDGGLYIGTFVVFPFLVILSVMCLDLIIPPTNVGCYNAIQDYFIIIIITIRISPFVPC